MSENALEVKDLCKNYIDFSLNNVSFTLPKGTVMGFIGENGAGKTTTIKAILNLINRDNGTIRILGKDNLTDEKDIKENLGVVFADQNFPESFTAKDVCTMMRHIYKNWDTPLFKTYLKDFNLPFEKPSKDFSKGMKTKLAIAATLSHHPTLLILDEATSGLDPIVRNEILDIFYNFIADEDHAVLLSTHIVSDLEHIADYITFLHQGQVLLSDSKDQLIYNHGIVKCSYAQFKTLTFSDGIRMRCTDFGTEVLIQNPDLFAQKHPDIIIDRPSLEDLMLFYVKGASL